MDLQTGLIEYARALGRCETTWRFADADVREVVACALVSRAWDAFLRDAGPGDVGRARQQEVGTQALLRANDDPRRDALLLCLADASSPLLAAAATLLARATDARRRFDSDAQELVETASDALSAGPGPTGPVRRELLQLVGRASAVEALGAIVGAVDRLRNDPRFTEASGTEVRHELPRGSFSHYVAADPGATWSLNLALLLRGSPIASVPTPAFCGRVVFRLDLDPDDIAAALVEQAATALLGVESLFEQTLAELTRGRVALEHLSRNSRAFDTWKLVVALGEIRRPQLARALSLSRAGADIQAHVLADAGLADLRPNGSVTWARKRRRDQPSPTLSNDLQAAAKRLDASIADIDRLLAQSSFAGSTLKTADTD